MPALLPVTASNANGYCRRASAEVSKRGPVAGLLEQPGCLGVLPEPYARGALGMDGPRIFAGSLPSVRIDRDVETGLLELPVGIEVQVRTQAAARIPGQPEGGSRLDLITTL